MPGLNGIQYLGWTKKCSQTSNVHEHEHEHDPYYHITCVVQVGDSDSDGEGIDIMDLKFDALQKKLMAQRCGGD